MQCNNSSHNRTLIPVALVSNETYFIQKLEVGDYTGKVQKIRIHPIHFVIFFNEEALVNQKKSLT